MHLSRSIALNFRKRHAERPNVIEHCIARVRASRRTSVEQKLFMLKNVGQYSLLKPPNHELIPELTFRTPKAGRSSGASLLLLPLRCTIIKASSSRCTGSSCHKSRASITSSNRAHIESLPTSELASIALHFLKQAFTSFGRSPATT